MISKTILHFLVNLPFVNSHRLHFFTSSSFCASAIQTEELIKFGPRKLQTAEFHFDEKVPLQNNSANIKNHSECDHKPISQRDHVANSHSPLTQKKNGLVIVPVVNQDQRDKPHNQALPDFSFDAENTAQLIGDGQKFLYEKEQLLKRSRANRSRHTIVDKANDQQPQANRTSNPGKVVRFDLSTSNSPERVVEDANNDRLNSKEKENKPPILKPPSKKLRERSNQRPVIPSSPDIIIQENPNPTNHQRTLSPMERPLFRPAVNQWEVMFEEPREGMECELCEGFWDFLKRGFMA